MLKRAFVGRHWFLVTSYLGNVSVSFALYFLAIVAGLRVGRGPLFAAVSSLLVVEAFEVTNGFGVMLNTFDPWDLLANALGVAMGLVVDIFVLARPYRGSQR
jgi:hypothetical protein